MSRPHGHSEAGWIQSMKNVNYTIRNRTRDTQPTAPPRVCVDRIGEEIQVFRVVKSFRLINI